MREGYAATENNCEGVIRRRTGMTRLKQLEQLKKWLCKRMAQVTVAELPEVIRSYNDKKVKLQNR